MLTLLTLLSMAVALAAFFAVMLWLDPKRRQYAAATAVAVGAVGLADTAPTVGGAALAQDDPPEIIVHGDLPSNCERRDSGDIFCDGTTLLDWCTWLGAASQGENLCMGGYGGGSSGGSGGSSGGGSDSGGDNVPTYTPPMPVCPCGMATWVNGSGEAYGAAIGGHWQCPSLLTCHVGPPLYELVTISINAACERLAVAAGLACTALRSRGQGLYAVVL